MKNVCVLLIVTFLHGSVIGQIASSNTSLSTATINTNSYHRLTEGLDISKFAISVSPTGFLQFGPVISAEFGVNSNVVINTHVRLARLGVLSYLVRAHDDGLDRLKGMAFGGGVYYLFGERRSKPYAGIIMEYEKTDALYAKNEQWEWSEINKTIVFVVSGGYRFRFVSGFFINTGANIGIAATSYDWQFNDITYGSGGDGSEIKPFGMLDVTLGMEF